MNSISLQLGGHELVARGSGALYWPAERLLCVSDLHLGKAGRIARLGGTMLPPYETRDTLARLEAELQATDAANVICLGDSFDDLTAAASLDEAAVATLARLSEGRDWFWIEGNHDAGPVDLPGTHRSEICVGSLNFRHIASHDSPEVSGHYHPKARLSLRGASVSRPCFLADGARIVMPAFGTFTGGLCCTSPVLSQLMGREAVAVLTGAQPVVVPMPVRRRHIGRPRLPGARPRR